MLHRLAPAGVGLLALCSWFSSVTSIPDPNTVQFSFEKRKASSIESDLGLQRRQSGTVNTQITNEYTFYIINVTVGTPGQPFSLQLDTGSSDIWFPVARTDVCEQEGCPLGAFNPDASSTLVQLDDLGEFQIQYVDGTQITGPYISDVLNIGQTSLTKMTMAAALQASRGFGVMGIGFRAGESSNVGESGFTYPNVINVLKDQGHIQSLSYSLWLDDLQADTGSILFGGVDTDKYEGDLVVLPIQNDAQSGILTSFTVAWTGLTVTGAGNNADFSPSTAQPAILDSGTTITYVPDAIANNLYNAFGVITDPTYGSIVPCTLGGNDLNFTFEFGGQGGAKISVPLSEFVQEIPTRSGRPLHFRDGREVCLFGIEGAGQNPILFGDSFLRSAYVVYDLENNSIGLAQTNFNSNTGTGKAQAIGSDGIPNVASTADAVTVQQTFTGNPAITADQTAAATSDIGGETGYVSRSATLRLTATATASGSGGSSSGGSNDNNAASSNLKSVTSITGIIVAAFAFGFALVIM